MTNGSISNPDDSIKNVDGSSLNLFFLINCKILIVAINNLTSSQMGT